MGLEELTNETESLVSQLKGAKSIAVTSHLERMADADSLICEKIIELAAPDATVYCMLDPSSVSDDAYAIMDRFNIKYHDIGEPLPADPDLLVFVDCQYEPGVSLLPKVQGSGDEGARELDIENVPIVVSSSKPILSRIYL